MILKDQSNKPNKARYKPFVPGQKRLQRDPCLKTKQKYKSWGDGSVHKVCVEQAMKT